MQFQCNLVLYVTYNIRVSGSARLADPREVSDDGGSESGPLRAVHLSRHKWPGGLIN